MKPTILFLAFIILTLITSCGKMSEKEAYDKVVDDSIYLKDTLMQYSLTSDSLVLEFVNTQQHKKWVGEVFIWKKKGERGISEIHIAPPSTQSEENELGLINFKNGKVVFKGFHIPEDSLSFYNVRIRAVPTFPGCRGIGEVYFPAYLFASNDKKPGFLTLSPFVKDLNIVKVDLVQLKKLPWELQESCRNSIESEYGITYTDAEIEESHY